MTEVKVKVKVERHAIRPETREGDPTMSGTATHPTNGHRTSVVKLSLHRLSRFPYRQTTQFMIKCVGSGWLFLQGSSGVSMGAEMDKPVFRVPTNCDRISHKHKEVSQMNEQKSLLLEIAEVIDRRLRRRAPQEESTQPVKSRPRWLYWVGTADGAEHRHVADGGCPATHHPLTGRAPACPVRHLHLDHLLPGPVGG